MAMRRNVMRKSVKMRFFSPNICATWFFFFCIASAVRFFRIFTLFLQFSPKIFCFCCPAQNILFEKELLGFLLWITIETVRMTTEEREKMRKISLECDCDSKK
jgi:hypothetical protein